MITQCIATKGKYGGGTIGVSTFGKFIESIGAVLLPIQVPILDLISEIVALIDLDSEIENGDF